MGISTLKAAILRKKGAPSVPKANPYLTPTLQLGNSYSYLHTFPGATLEAVRQALTYTNDSIYFEIQKTRRLLQMAQRRMNDRMVWLMKRKIEELEAQRVVCFLKDNRFPTGHLELVRVVLGYSEYTLEDSRIQPGEPQFFRWANDPPELRYYQREAVDSAKAAGRGVLALAVGTGKSLCAATLIKELEVVTLVVLPSTALVEQTQRSIEEWFGKKYVGVVSTAAIKNGKRLAPIRLATLQTLASLNKQKLLHRVLHGVGMFIYDEFHHAASASGLALLDHLDSVFYRFGLTATFLRNDHKTLDLWGVLSNTVYEYPPQRAIEEGYLTPVRYQVRSLPGKRHKNYDKEYSLNYGENEEFLGAIRDILETIPGNEQVLLLVDRKEKVGEILHAALTEWGIENTYVSGDDKKDTIIDAIEAFNDELVRVLIGSGVIGEGVDIKSASHLILARGGKSPINIVQGIGRCVRLHPGKSQSWVYDFEFEGTNYLAKHTAQRIATFREYFAGDVEGFGAIQEDQE